MKYLTTSQSGPNPQSGQEHFKVGLEIGFILEGCPVNQFILGDSFNFKRPPWLISSNSKDLNLTMVPLMDMINHSSFEFNAAYAFGKNQFPKPVFGEKIPNEELGTFKQPDHMLDQDGLQTLLNLEKPRANAQGYLSTLWNKFEIT